MHAVIVSPYDPAPPDAAEARLAHVGGVERVLHRHAAEVAAAGHEVTLLCSTAGRPSASVEGRVRTVRVRRSGTLLRAPIVDLARHIPRDADVVQVPATYPFTTPAVLRAAARRGLPAILDFHFEPDPGTAAGRAAAAAYRPLAARAYPRATRVLVRSLAYAQGAPSLARVPVARWRVVPNGVDPARFRPAAGSAAEAGDYLLVVGRLVPYKGVGTLLLALARLPSPPPLVVAGDGPLRPQLEAQALQLGLPVRFLGRVPDEALPGLYQRARLTVLPSVNGQEAFGVCLVESMACGTPVVASRLPGVADVAAEGGLLAEPGDPASLAQALRAALAPGALHRGEALAARARATYAWPVIAQRLLAVYDEVAGGVGRAGPREAAIPARPARGAAR